jgi:hypothetical protein
LSVSATGVEKDVVTVRLKNAFVNDWYKELQIIVNTVLMNIDDNLTLKSMPLVFDKEIIIITPEDVRKEDELTISKDVGQYTFVHSGYDLIITNAFDTDAELNKLCTVYIKDFYKKPRMETLSIKFDDKEILLSNEMDKINNAPNIGDYNHIHSMINLQEKPISWEKVAGDSNATRRKRHLDKEFSGEADEREVGSLQEQKHNPTTTHQRNRLAIDVEEVANSEASSATRSSNPINNLVNLVKEKSGKLLSNIINGLYKGTAEKSESLSGNAREAKSPECYEDDYDPIQDMEFEYMEQYDRSNLKQKDKTIDIHGKKHGKQEKQQCKSKDAIDVTKYKHGKNINQSRVISSEKQQWLEAAHSKQKQAFIHHVDRKQSQMDERKQHIATQKQFSHQYNSNQMMIGGTHKWCERISNDSNRRMIGSTNQKQQNSHSQSRTPLTQVTAQVDIPSTLFAVNVLAMSMTNQKYNKPLPPQKIQKALRYVDKVRAESSVVKNEVRIG